MQGYPTPLFTLQNHHPCRTLKLISLISILLNSLVNSNVTEMHTTFKYSIRKLIGNCVTASPPNSPPESALAAFDMTRLSLWNLYHNQPSPPEPQKEPINLEKREDPVGPPPPKRHQPDTEETKMAGTHIKISSRSESYSCSLHQTFYYVIHNIVQLLS